MLNGKKEFLLDIVCGESILCSVYNVKKSDNVLMVGKRWLKNKIQDKKAIPIPVIVYINIYLFITKAFTIKS